MHLYISTSGQREVQIAAALRFVLKYFENPKTARLSKQEIEKRMSPLYSVLELDEYIGPLYRVQSKDSCTIKGDRFVSINYAQSIVSWSATERAAREFYEDSRLSIPSYLLRTDQRLVQVLNWRWVAKLVDVLKSPSTLSSSDIRIAHLAALFNHEYNIFRDFEKEVLCYNTPNVQCSILDDFR